MKEANWVLRCRGYPLRNYRGEARGWGSPSLSLEGCGAYSTLMAEGRIKCRISWKWTLGSFPHGLVGIHPKRSLVFPQRPRAGKTGITIALVFWVPCQGKPKWGGRNLYFPFSFICMEQQNEGMWWLICDCKWKMRPINLHSQFKQKERGDAIGVTNGKMFPHRLYLLSLWILGFPEPFPSTFIFFLLLLAIAYSYVSFLLEILLQLWKRSLENHCSSLGACMLFEVAAVSDLKLESATMP